ncbi:hypothetical protein K458DRAFT_148276 [Lentithecium fluviatile CBS 122367]|uniref:Uncharacterized protein n=1 Tax=Lentithecium fluviatile CBS 122367 TaxID=1168545 RepID=A0A6G1JE08_9PLEO|nr:hypothetical protein K458DRAFT_148276 [Lentithecium fluviatile CBS 122367]
MLRGYCTQNTQHNPQDSSDTMQMAREMRFVLYNQPCCAKRGPPDPLESEPKRLRPSMMYGTILSIEEVTSEDMEIDENVDNTAQSQWQTQQQLDANDDIDMDIKTSATDSRHSFIDGLSRMHNSASINQSKQSLGNGNGTAVTYDAPHYVVTATNIAIHLTNGEQITKRSARTPIYPILRPEPERPGQTGQGPTLELGPV